MTNSGAEGDGGHEVASVGADDGAQDPGCAACRSGCSVAPLPGEPVRTRWQLGASLAQAEGASDADDQGGEGFQRIEHAHGTDGDGNAQCGAGDYVGRVGHAQVDA